MPHSCLVRISRPTISPAGKTDVFINLDLKTLETHAGLARVIIGSFLNAIYNRNGEITGRALFLLDEVARLGYHADSRDRA